jgi:hypothetical protein
MLLITPMLVIITIVTVIITSIISITDSFLIHLQMMITIMPMVVLTIYYSIVNQSRQFISL